MPLRCASVLLRFPLTPDGELVLISDGRATTGDAASEADRLADDEVPVDVVVVEPNAGADLAVAGVDVPSLARAGEQIDVDVRIDAPAATDAEVVLRRDGAEVERRIVPLDAGENTVRFCRCGGQRWGVALPGRDRRGR